MAQNNLGTIPVQIASPSLTSGEITFIQSLSSASAYDQSNVVLMNRNNGGSPLQVLRVKSDGSGLEWSSASGGIGGTISTGQVAFGTASNVIGGDTNFTWDNVNKRLIISDLKIGTIGGVLKASSGNVSGGATTSDLPEGTNLYYTDTRARNALSANTPITYNQSNGVIGLSTPLSISYGGTGLSSLGTASQLLRVNSSETGLEYFTPDFVSGPSSSTNNNIVLFDGTTGKLIKDGGKGLPSGNIVGTSDAQTLTNKRIQKRTSSTTSASSLTPDISSYDLYQFTALAANLTINNPTGSPVLGDVLVILIKDDGTSRTLTFGNGYKPMGQALPTATTAGKTMEIIAEYDGSNWLTSYVNEV